jgi:hypothetical protein
MRIDDPALEDMIHRYVRGEMSAEEADRFEEAYFADDRLAALLEAEQLLVGNADLIEAPEAPSAQPGSGSEAGLGVGPKITKDAGRWIRRCAYAAGFLLVPVAIMLIKANMELNESRSIIDQWRSQAASARQPAVVVQTIRLSPVRSAGSDAPAFRFPLPKDQGQAVRLALPLPPQWQESGADEIGLMLTVRQASGESEIVWTHTQLIDDSRDVVEVSLPSGSLEVGHYLLELSLSSPQGSAGPLVFAFEIAR